jgi:hypothetical protein
VQHFTNQGHPGKGSSGQSVNPAKRHPGKAASRQSIIPAKCHPGKASSPQSVIPAKRHPSKAYPVMLHAGKYLKNCLVCLLIKKRINIWVEWYELYNHKGASPNNLFSLLHLPVLSPT